MKFSFVIPVYNVEKYIATCLTGVCSQSYTDWECICVDDGSDDACARILDEFAQKDRRIRVIHKNNEGVSVARNVGIDHSCGDWIVFVDSDDAIASDHLQRIAESISLASGLDILMIKPVLCDLDGHRQLMIYDAPETFTIAGDVLEGVCCHSAKHQILSCVWDKVFRRTFLLQHQIRFLPGLQIAEDSLFDEIAFSHATLFRYDATINTYTYIRREGSLYTQISDKAWFNQIRRVVAEIENSRVVTSRAMINLAALGAASLFFLPHNVATERRAAFISEMIKDGLFLNTVLPFAVRHCHIKARVMALLFMILPNKLCELFLTVLNRHYCRF